MRGWLSNGLFYTSRHKKSKMDKYENIVQSLRQQIACGTYGPGDRLPTIPQLCSAYSVSKITVKRAMDELELQGLVTRRRGSGTYVTGLPQGMGGAGDSAGRLRGFTAEREARGERADTLVREFEVVPAEAGIARDLNLQPSELCYRIERTLYADGIPVQDQTLHIPLQVVPNLLRSHVEGSIYRYIEEELGLRIASAHRRVIAIRPSDNTAEHLQIDTSDAILKIFQTTYLDDGRPCEKSVSLHVPSYEYLSISTR